MIVGIYWVLGTTCSVIWSLYSMDWARDLQDDTARLVLASTEMAVRIRGGSVLLWLDLLVSGFR